LVIDEMRKIESRVTGGPPMARLPSASTWTSSPARHERHEAGHERWADVLLGGGVQTLDSGFGQAVRHQDAPQQSYLPLLRT
jgi:hypothetical protein